jgi:hypothetical protein
MAAFMGPLRKEPLPDRLISDRALGEVAVFKIGRSITINKFYPLIVIVDYFLSKYGVPKSSFSVVNHPSFRFPAQRPAFKLGRDLYVLRGSITTAVLYMTSPKIFK